MRPQIGLIREIGWMGNKCKDELIGIHRNNQDCTYLNSQPRYNPNYYLKVHIQVSQNSLFFSTSFTLLYIYLLYLLHLFVGTT